MSIENVDRLVKKLSKLDSSIQQDIMMETVRQCDKQVQKKARLSVPYNSNNLRRSILIKEEVKGDKIVGSVYTNLEYAPYVEFGTGPVGQKNHQGISPEVTPKYRQTGWGIPASKVSKKDAEKYGWEKRIYKGKEYYMTYGQPAQPFLYPALKDQEKGLKKFAKNHVAKKIKEICKND